MTPAEGRLFRVPIEFVSRQLRRWMSMHGVVPAARQPGRRFLHVGCGRATKKDLWPAFRADDWREIRLDVDPRAEPDILGTMLDLSKVPLESLDAVYSSHSIEHLYPHEVPVALEAFLRVLKPEGFLLVGCPDLQSICSLVAADKLEEAAYESAAGPIAALDVLYGHRPSMAAGSLHMAHHTGFTLKTLVRTLKSAGFRSVLANRREARFDLWAVATKNDASEDDLKRLGAEHFPP
jgi:SAM-dependent methyltransferase